MKCPNLYRQLADNSPGLPGIEALATAVVVDPWVRLLFHLVCFTMRHGAIFPTCLISKPCRAMFLEHELPVCIGHWRSRNHAEQPVGELLFRIPGMC